MRPVKAVVVDLGIDRTTLDRRAKKLGITYYRSRKQPYNGTSFALVSEAQECALREFPNRRKQP
jgi:hypothetical protein